MRRTNEKFSLFLGCALLFCGLFSAGCKPSKRLARLQKMHPELFQVTRVDSFQIRPGVDRDSFFFLSQKDTIIFKEATIYRDSDRFRFVGHIPACTTFIARTEIRPIAERKTTREVLKDIPLKTIVILLFGAVILNIIANGFINRRRRN